MNNYDLPTYVRQLADLIGRENAMKLVHEFGRWLYVPRVIKPDHRIAKVVGIENAHKMSEEFSCIIIELGICKSLQQRLRNERIREMHSEGMRIKTISIAMNLSQRQIANII